MSHIFKAGDLILVRDLSGEFTVTSIDAGGVYFQSVPGVTVYRDVSNVRLSELGFINRINEKLPEDPQKLMQTEGVKHDQGKPPLSLIDREFAEGVARVLGFGAKKYAAHNWRKGMKYSRLMDAALRHAYAFIDGEDTDPESGESHLYHAACCLMFAAKMHSSRPDLDDRHKQETKETQ